MKINPIRRHTMEKTLPEAVRLIAESTSFIITTHVMPDGDGLGAEVALYHYLKRIGKNVRIVNPDVLPDRYRFLDHAGAVEVLDPKMKNGGLQDFDMAVIMDTSDPRRINGLWEIFSKKAKYILIVDHHPNLAPHLNVTDRARIHTLVDEKSSSIGELLFRFFHSANDVLDSKATSFRFSPEIALGLYVSIITDTNSFRYASTTSLSHRIAADLIDYGLQPEEIYQNVYSSKSANHLRLIGEVLANVKENGNSKIVWVEIPKDLRKKYKATSDDTQSIVNYLLLHKDGEVLCLIREEDDGKIKVSLKSKGNVQINSLANEMGGGGHEYAAGYSVQGNIASVRDNLISKLEKLL